MASLDPPQPLSMVLKPGLDHMVRLEKSQTGHFCSLFNMKNHSMQKKSVNRTDHSRTSRFCEP